MDMAQTFSKRRRAAVTKLVLVNIAFGAAMSGLGIATAPFLSPAADLWHNLPMIATLFALGLMAFCVHMTSVAAILEKLRSIDLEQMGEDKASPSPGCKT
jgi:hypothetical protein